MITSILFHTTMFFCTYVYPFIQNIYKFVYNRYKLLTTKYIEPDSIDENVKGWKCLAYYRNDKYEERYIDYGSLGGLTEKLCKTRWALFIEKLDNGFYLYNNNNPLLQNGDDGDDGNNKCSDDYKKSLVFFFSIVISQGDNEYEMILKKDEFIVGNQLLTPLHIMRYAKYNNWKNWRDNEPYTITIMDNKIKTVELNCNQAILLEKMKYAIVYHHALLHWCEMKPIIWPR